MSVHPKSAHITRLGKDGFVPFNNYLDCMSNFKQYFEEIVRKWNLKMIDKNWAEKFTGVLLDGT